MKKVVLIFVALIVATTACYAEVERCKTIHRQDGRIYTVTAKLHSPVHVILPEPIIGKPINGNVDLWEVDSANNHLFIKPTSNMKDGKETSVSVIGVSNTSYDFRVKRGDKSDLCVLVKNDGSLIQGGALNQWVPPAAHEAAALRQQLTQLQNSFHDLQERNIEQVEDAMTKYRGHIYTRYKWSAGNGFMGKKAISDVWDDGRWTYIRVASDNKGLLTVSGVQDSEKELLEYQYDRENMIYKIVGIYPNLFLRYGESDITVTRADETTAGAF